jgi:Xaa-Pro aminopeptidase
MHDQFKKRVLELQRRLADDRLDVAVLTDPGTVYYLASYWDYLGMEFGRPTMLVVPRSGSCALITPALEEEMARAMTWVEDLRTWKDGNHWEWAGHLCDLLGGYRDLALGIEADRIPGPILDCLRRDLPASTIVDVSDTLADMRMIKEPEEITDMRRAGDVAAAMADAGIAAIGEGVPEYEVALAVIAGGTRKAASLLGGEGPERLMSPVLHFLQVLKSGPEVAMTHRRATGRRIRRGDPVTLCFCGITEFKHLKLGFDRGLFVGTAEDEQFELYDVALRSQLAAVAAMRPGVPACDVYAAAKAVLLEAGFDAGNNRVGRGIGYSFAEKPELTQDEKTVLRPGMTFAMSGSIKIPGKCNHHVGDSFVITESGCDFLTDYPRELRIV